MLKIANELEFASEVTESMQLPIYLHRSKLAHVLNIPEIGWKIYQFNSKNR